MLSISVNMDMTDRPTNHVEILLDYSEYFEEQIARETRYVLTGIEVRIGDTFLIGGSETDFFTIDYVLDWTLPKLVECVDEILVGNPCTVRFRDNPHDMTFTPDGDNVRINYRDFDGQPYNPDIPSEGLAATREATAAAIIEASEEFLDRIVQIEPEIAELDAVADLEAALDRARDAYAEY